jgi:hypothetical protein
MKTLLLFVVTAAIFVGCTNTDKKTSSSNDRAIKDSIREQVLKDSANFTTIQWIDSTSKDLGKVKEGQIVEVSYRFKNTGSKNLIITDVSASCGCTVPEKPEEPIAPGNEGVIKAKFDSKGRPHGENKKEVYVSGNITPSNSQILSFRVEITD